MKKLFATAKRAFWAFCVGFGVSVGAVGERGWSADFSFASDERDFAASASFAESESFRFVAATTPFLPPSWAFRSAANGVWSSSGASAARCEFERSAAVLRGQSVPPPPAISPSTPTQIAESTVVGSATNVVTPPVVGDDEPFAPIVASTDENSTAIQKFFKYKQQISGYYLYMPKAKDGGLGVNEFEARLLFAFPCGTARDQSCVNNGCFFLTPSFVYDNWSIPNSQKLRYEMPKSTFDVGLTTTLAATLGELDVNVEVQAGVASTFKRVDRRAFYVRGRAMGALPVDSEGKVKITGGAIYYDRINYKIMPSGGFLWTPNARNVLSLVFPDPRWYHYLTKINETDWWFYVNGDIGGGRYMISSADAWSKSGNREKLNTDYDDYRFGVGLTFDCPSRLRGCFEVGGAFKRKLVAKTGTWYSPKDSVYLKVGLLY